MSDPRSLLNPPSTTAEGETIESLLNPIPGRLPIDEGGRDGGASQDELRSIESLREGQAAA